MRIGIDGTCLAVQRGYGRFLREMLPVLLECDQENDYVLFIDEHSAEVASAYSLETVRVATDSGQAESASAKGSRSIRDLRRMGKAVADADLDLVYFPSVYSYHPVPGSVPVAVAFHDTIAERYARIVFPSWRTRLLWRAKVRMALRRASGIITVSNWSRDSLADWFKIPCERIFVTPEAPSPVFAPTDDLEETGRVLEDRGLDPGSRYLIYVGGFNPHKNLDRLIDAFGRVAADQSSAGLHLVLIGDYEGDLFHSAVQSLREDIGDQGLDQNVHFFGFVPDEELRFLYAGAEALVLPSLEEGFGLPAVEAAACGTPCLATLNSPLPQLLSNGGLFFDPLESDEMYEAMTKLLGDQALRNSLAAAALAQSAQLSWKTTAEATRRALVSIAQS